MTSAGRRKRRRFWTTVTLGACVSHVALAHGPQVPEHGITLGPSVAYAHAPRLNSGLSYGLDAVYAYRTLWAGVGLRAFERFDSQERQFLPYLEGGVYLLLNVGGGYTFDVDDDNDDLSGAHFFLGLPLPVGEDGDRHWLYFIEPYYRPTFAGAGTVHEIGLLLKWRASWMQSHRDSHSRARNVRPGQ